jgi:hypothetical protein
MYCRIPGFLAIIRVGSFPLPFPPTTSPVSKERGGGGGEGAKSYDGEKAWYSIIH